jgi:predicted negative regulator of RcsB-dependent stress response
MAIDELLDEHEQGERVRAWLRRNGAGILGGIVLGIALIYGWRWWQSEEVGRRVQAGEAHAAVAAHVEAGELEQAVAAADRLDDGIYSLLARLDLAKGQLDAGERDAAIATLRAAGTEDPALGQVVEQRLARLLVDAGQGEEALRLLADASDPVALEARGDAYVALGRREEARSAYADALTRLDVDAPQRRLLEIKLTDAGGTPAQPETRT